jgi:16S rRNA (uracil1498-N3)-methyltransferase
VKRFVLSVQPGPGGVIRLYEKDYHYLVRVRRLKSGSCFDAVLPGGKEAQVRVLSTENGILVGECLEAPPVEAPREGPRSPIPPIALFQGLPKGAKMDLIVRQAAEGGVSIVVPFKSEYSVARQDGRSKDAEAKPERWKRIVREARQQSGSTIETEIHPFRNLDAVLEYWASIKQEYKNPLGILFHQRPLENGSLHGYLGNSPDFVALAVGPEGGFSPGEVSLFLAEGFKPLLLGDTVLRTETAALYGTAAVRIILLESKIWTSGLTGSCSSKFPLT